MQCTSFFVCFMKAKKILSIRQVCAYTREASSLGLGHDILLEVWPWKVEIYISSGPFFNLSFPLNLEYLPLYIYFSFVFILEMVITIFGFFSCVFELILRLRMVYNWLIATSVDLRYWSCNISLQSLVILIIYCIYISYVYIGCIFAFVGKKTIAHSASQLYELERAHWVGLGAW